MSFSLLVLTLMTSLTLGASPVPCPPGQTRVPVTVVDGTINSACKPADESTRASPAETERYAAKERATPRKVSEFRGGDVGIYISGGVVVVLLVVILVLLLV